MLAPMRVPFPRRGWRLWLLIAVAVLVAVRVSAPYALEWAIERQATQALGVPVRVGDVDLWLVFGGVELEDLRIGQRTVPMDTPEVDPADALLAWSRVYARIGWLDLPFGRVRIRDLEVDEPALKLVRDENGRIEPLPPAPPELEAPEPVEDEGGGLPFLLDRLAVKAANLRLLSADPSRPGLVELSIEEFSLADLGLDERGEISLGGIGISGPKLRVLRDYAFEPPAPAEAPAAISARPPAGTSAPQYAVKRISIERAAFTLVMPETALDVAIGLQAEDVTAKADTTFPVKLAIEVAEGTVGIDARVGLDPLVFDGDVRWQGLHLPPLLATLGPGPATWVRSGVAGGNLHAALRLSPLAEAPARVTGTLSLSDLLVHDPAEDVSVAWKSLDVAIDEALVFLRPGAGAPQVALASVRLVDPAIAYTLPAPALDELTAGAPAEGEPSPEPPDVAAAPPTAAPAPRISLASLELTGGRLDFTDRTVTPFQKAELRALAIAAKDVRFPERDVRDLKLSAQLPGKGKLDVRGDLRGGNGEIQLALDQMGLAPFNPYATSYGGVAIDSGSTTLKTDVKIRGARIDADNQLVIQQLGVSSHDASVVPGLGVPIDLALALLRDTKGDITLPIPVVVDEMGAGAGIGAIVAGALKAALVGALQSPLKGLGLVAGAFGGSEGGLGVEPLRCLPGAADLAPEEEQRLTALAEMLASRPTLALALHGRTGPADGPGLAEQILVERIETDDPPELEGSGFFQRRRLTAALRDRARGRAHELSAEDTAMLARWIAAVEIPPARLQSLAGARAETLLARLVSEHGVPTTRVSVAGSAEPGDPGVVVDLAAASVP